MPTPQAICIEDLVTCSELERFTVCVAVPGNEPGLALDRKGRVLWRKRRVTGCELWISQDDRLMLLRPRGAASVKVHREGRFLEAPFDKPVVLIDQDEVEVGQKRFRLHLHGRVDDVFAPEPYPLRDGGVGRVVRATAAALAIGVAAGGPGCDRGQGAPAPSRQVERPAATVDTGPPAPAQLAREDAGPVPSVEPDAGGAVAADAGAGPAGDEPKKKKKPKIKIRTRPPKPIMPRDDDLVL